MKNMITKIEATKRDKNRASIFVDEEFIFACSIELVYRFNLKVGEMADLEKLKDVVLEDNYLKGKAIALRYIECYSRTEKEVASKLISKEFSEGEIERIMNFMKEYGFVDDDRYLRAYINDNKNKLGKNKIKFTLTKKGISERKIDEELNLTSNEENQDIVYKIAKKKYEIISKNDIKSKIIYKKLWDFLMRQGFDNELIKNSLDKIIILENDNSEENYIEKDTVKLMELAEKKLNSIRKNQDDEFIIKKKLFDFLMRRGYQYSEIKEIYNALIDN